MGAAEARLLAAEGASVVLADVQDEAGTQVAEEMAAEGLSAMYLHLDVSDEDRWQRVVEDTVRAYGRLDVLVNNAGIGGGGDEVTDFTVAQWDRVIGVNATGVFLGTKHCARAMRRNPPSPTQSPALGGSIVNISSVYGLVGAPSGAAYPASKGAVRAFTKAAAVQLAPDNIRVNSVHPGFIDTPQTRWMMADPDIVQSLKDRTPLGWIAGSEHIAWGVLYLASDESAYMTGSEFVIDGGITAQ